MATHVGSEIALSQIVQIVEAAQLARAPVQKLADRISKVFVPAVVVAAVVTFLGWFIPGVAGIYPKSWIPKAVDEFELALQFCISVLVVACPCALGLATPTAVMVATGKGASQGVLIKGGNALEKAHKVNTVVFDKTGTLTVGKPEVVSAVLFSGILVEELCNTAIAVENSDNRNLIDRPRSGGEAIDKSRMLKVTEISEQSQCLSSRLPDNTSSLMRALLYTVFQPQAPELYARKVAAASGDMMKALQDSRGAIEMFETELRENICTSNLSSMVFSV